MHQNITTYILCGFFIITACIVQAVTFLNVDSSWLTESALKLLSGKDLYTDYTETNPPFIIYLMAPPVWLGELLGLKPQVSFKLFTMALLLVALWRVFKLVSSDFLRIVITFGLFALSVQSFGQREHLFIALLMPYFLSIMNRQSPSKFDVALVLVGFLLKPYFVVYFIGLALWQWVVQKRSLFLKENFVIGFTLLAYVALIWVLERDYFTNVLPLLTKYYDQFYYLRTSIYIKILIFLLLIMSLKIISSRDDKPIIDEDISLVIFGAFLGGLTLILQDKGWTNHFLPLYFFLLLAIGMFMERAPKFIIYIMSALMVGVIAHVTLINVLSICHPGSKSEKIELIALQNKYAAGKDVLQMSFDLSAIYPDVLYSDANFNWQYPTLWMLAGMYDKKDIKDGKIIYHRPEAQNADEARIFRSYVDYVVSSQPAMLVYTDSRVRNERLGEFKFNFVEYFSQDAEFAAQFTKYKPLRRIGTKQIYVLDQELPQANIPGKR